MTCLSIVMVLHYLYRAAVSALFSLVVLLITYCVVKSHFILLFEQIKKERKRIITINISDCRQFSDSHISQGSVATYVRCGGILRHDYVANLQLSLSAKEFRKSVNISGSYGQEFRVFLLTVAH